MTKKLNEPLIPADKHEEVTPLSMRSKGAPDDDDPKYDANTHRRAEPKPRVIAVKKFDPKSGNEQE